MSLRKRNEIKGGLIGGGPFEFSTFLREINCLRARDKGCCRTGGENSFVFFELCSHSLAQGAIEPNETKAHGRNRRKASWTRVGPLRVAIAGKERRETERFELRKCGSRRRKTNGVADGSDPWEKKRWNFPLRGVL
ncbi:hypothetical protein RUM43_004191 [Polyplax serrata]|uniref:Uncharacterized protein n=1 Tax=Polyplax serrata TaxID=468196 RepID=A0AAN8SBD3_POLSC